MNLCEHCSGLLLQEIPHYTCALSWWNEKWPRESKIDIEGGNPHFLYQTTIVFEGFEIQTFDETRVWFQKEDGEGFVIESSKIKDCLEKFFQENM